MATRKIRSADEIMGRISSMQEQIVDKDLISCIYGYSGVGKTVLNMAIAQAIREATNDPRPILYLDSSDGFVSLEDWPSLMEDVDRYRVDDYRELSVIGDAVRLRKKGFQDYGITVMDEASSWYLDMLHSWVREDEGLPEDAPLPEIKGKQYGPPTHALLDIVGKFHKTENMHLLLVSHEQERGGDSTKRAEPSLPPAFLRGLNQKMHLVARVEGIIRTDGYKRTVQTQPSRKVVAKSRISTLSVVEEFEDVPEKIADWLTGATIEHDLSKPESDMFDIEHEDEDIQVVEDGVDDGDAVEVA